MVETVVEMNNYLLKGNKKNESWQLRSNDVSVLVNGKRRTLRYCKEESSIYKDEQSSDSKVTFIWFVHGVLRVSPEDKTLNKYIQNHPDFGKKFYLHNEEADAQNELKKIEQEDEIRLLLNALSLEEKEAVATVLFGMNVVSRWSPDKIKLECYNFLKKNPARLLEVIKDPATELIYLVSAGIKLNVLEISSDKTSIRWYDSKDEIIPVPRGVNPLTEMSQFLRTNDALVTLQEIGDRINKKKGVRVSKKTTKPAPKK